MSDVDPSGILQGTARGIMNAVACYTQENSTFARVQQDNLPTANKLGSYSISATDFIIREGFSVRQNNGFVGFIRYLM